MFATVYERGRDLKNPSCKRSRRPQELMGQQYNCKLLVLFHGFASASGEAGSFLSLDEGKLQQFSGPITPMRILSFLLCEPPNSNPKFFQAIFQQECFAQYCLNLLSNFDIFCFCPAKVNCNLYLIHHITTAFQIQIH